MKTLVAIFADVIEQANAAPRDIAEGAAQELIDAAREAGFWIGPPNEAENSLIRATGLVGIFQAIHNERIQQDQQFGGPKQDDQMDGDDWYLPISHQLECTLGIGGAEFRERMVKVAATAVAAIESFDRQFPKTQQQDDKTLPLF